MSGIVAVDLGGRLGNQLFMVCAAACAAKDSGRSLHVYNTGTDNVAARMVSPHTPGLGAQTAVHAARMHRSVWSKATKLDEEPGGPLSFVPIVIPQKANEVVVVQGYRQHYMYLDKHWEWLAQHVLQVDVRRQKVLADLVGLPSLADSIVVHVRRGDYKKPAHIPIHDTLDTYYYVSALQQAVSETGLSHAVVFCEPCDYEYVRTSWLPFIAKRLNGKCCLEMANNMIGRTAWHEMLYMSTATALVIANSSFSWWAAWLSSCPTKRVYFPDEWFGIGITAGYNRALATPRRQGQGTWTSVPVKYQLLRCGATQMFARLMTVADTFSASNSYNGNELARDFSWPLDNNTNNRCIFVPRLAAVGLRADIACDLVDVYAFSVKELLTEHNLTGVEWVVFPKSPNLTFDHLHSDIWFLVQPDRFNLFQDAYASPSGWAVYVRLEALRRNPSAPQIVGSSIFGTAT